MRRLFAFFILASIKLVTRIFCEEEFNWTPSRDQVNLNQVRMIILLNHTSLYEPVFLSALPFTFLWKIAANISVPVADVTLKRPLVGLIYKLMLPKVSSITRKSDASWDNYLDGISDEDLVLIAAEGRMKRPGGLDKHGKKMTIRGGVADIIDRLGHGTILFCYSAGLHHIQTPGQTFPKLFQTVKMDVFAIDIDEYKSQFSKNNRERKMQIVQDLQTRLDSILSHP